MLHLGRVEGEYGDVPAWLELETNVFIVEPSLQEARELQQNGIQVRALHLSFVFAGVDSRKRQEIVHKPVQSPGVVLHFDEHFALFVP